MGRGEETPLGIGERDNNGEFGRKAMTAIIRPAARTITTTGKTRIRVMIENKETDGDQRRTRITTTTTGRVKVRTAGVKEDKTI